MKSELAQYVEGVLKNLDATSRLHAIPNSIYALVTVCGEAETTVHFDVSLADQYGKHSPESKNVTAWFRVPADWLNRDERIETMLARSLDCLKSDIEAERFVSIFTEDTVEKEVKP
jgi:hypothetical protein